MQVPERGRLVLCAVLVLGAVTGSAARAADSDARGAYNRGVDLYGRGDYNKAAEAFQQALDTGHKKTEAWTNYNLGNSRIEQAKAAAGQQPAAGIPLLKEALLFFRRALEFNPRDQDAKYNYEIAQQLLKQLEQDEQQQQDKQQQEPSPEQKEEEKKDPSSGQQKEPQQEQKQQESSAPENSEADKQQKDEAAPPQAKEQQEEDHQEEKQQAGAAQGEKEEQQKMTPQEAHMLLDNFQRAEKMSQQLLTPDPRAEEATAEKDW